MNTYDWHPWFAWYPVDVDVYEVRDIRRGKTRYKVWLRWVERKIVGAVAPDGDLTDYREYRPLQSGA